MQGAVHSQKENYVQKYKVTTTLKAIQAGELLTLHLHSGRTIPKEFHSAQRDGRLKFFSDHITLNGEVINYQDYIVCKANENFTRISKKHFEENFEEI